MREREPGSTNNPNNILSNILKTNMLNIKIFKLILGYSSTSLLGPRVRDRCAAEVISLNISQGENQK